jgi:hypothetical protein
MADIAPITAPPLQLIQGQADGYCDPVTGLCTLPGTSAVAPAPEEDPADELRSTGPDKVILPEFRPQRG